MQTYTHFILWILSIWTMTTYLKALFGTVPHPLNKELFPLVLNRDVWIFTEAWRQQPILFSVFEYKLGTWVCAVILDDLSGHKIRNNCLGTLVRGNTWTSKTPRTYLQRHQQKIITKSHQRNRGCGFLTQEHEYRKVLHSPLSEKVFFLLFFSWKLQIRL